ncbi:hypothetical protein XENTR_v10003183 [Xenopus tropicalis]|nr:hypothetical protein XENTR_v10003183 [Xenopus tropicalis]
MGPLSEVHSNRGRFEESQRALKGPVHYRSKHHISSSSSDSDKELKKSGKLSSKKTVVAQIHAPNFVFSADEIHEVDGKVKGQAKPIFREEETFVFFNRKNFLLFPPHCKRRIPKPPLSSLPGNKMYLWRKPGLLPLCRVLHWPLARSMGS